MKKVCILCGYPYDEETSPQIPPFERGEEEDFLLEEEELEIQEGVCPSCAMEV